MTLAGEHIVVVGGSSGIGEAAAALLASDGAKVVIASRDQAKLDAAVARHGGAFTGRPLDRGDQGQVHRFFADSSPIDHLVVTLSSSRGMGRLAELERAELAGAFDGKFWPTYTILRAALPVLRPDGSITLVTAASAGGALPGTSGLAAVNGALQAMVPPLAAELAPLRVNAVSPGVVRTPWWDGMPAEQREGLFAGIAAATPVGRVGEPEEVAQVIRLLVTNGFLTGTVIPCTGGATLPTGALGR